MSTIERPQRVITVASEALHWLDRAAASALAGHFAASWNRTAA